MKNISIRIKQYADYKGLSIRSIESKIGASNGVINASIKNNTDIQSKWLSIIIENFTDLNPYWLLTGNGEMINSPENIPINDLLKERDDIIISQAKRIMELEKEVSALKKESPPVVYGMVAEP